MFSAFHRSLHQFHGDIAHHEKRKAAIVNQFPHGSHLASMCQLLTDSTSASGAAREKRGERKKKKKRRKSSAS